MPKETKEEALTRAKEEGFPAGNVVQSDDGGWFIAPHGIKTLKAKRAYANCRADGGEKGTCAAVAHDLDKEIRGI